MGAGERCGVVYLCLARPVLLLNISILRTCLINFERHNNMHIRASGTHHSWATHHVPFYRTVRLSMPFKDDAA